MYTVYINIHYTHIMFINNKHIMCITHMYIHVNIHHRNEVSHQQDMILNPRWYHFRYTQTCNEYTLYFQYVHILYTYIVYIIVYIYCIHCIYCIHILYTYIQEMTHGYTWIIYWWLHLMISQKQDCQGSSHLFVCSNCGWARVWQNQQQLLFTSTLFLNK